MIKFYDLYKLIQNKSAPIQREQTCFKYWLMLEVSREVTKALDQWTAQNTNQLPFHDLFPQEITRTIIPFHADQNAITILKKIQQAGLTIDFKKGTVSNSKRIIRLGKYILNKTSSFTEQEKEWWTHSGQPIKELENTQNNQQYAIVVSRNPIDIVRMSDHDGWTSCHSPSREYFQCALADAKGAGAIAYVAKKEDLNKVDLQSPEIFTDRKRHIEGIAPISRIRLRKFIHKKDNFDLAVPENRTYGEQFPGLADSVRQWALKSQMPKLEKHGYERPRLKDFELMGGGYEDTKGSKLFNYFFGDDLDHGDADYGGEDDHQNMADQMETEVRNIEKEYRNKFTICSFYASVEDNDNEPYVSYGGTVYLQIPEELRITLPKPSDDIKWSETPQYKAREKVRKWAKKNDIYTINDIEINNNGEVSIHIYDENGNENGNENTPDSFRSFLANTLTDIEKKKDELTASLYHLFVELGFAKENKVKNISNNWDDHPHQFQNFKWEGDDPEVMVSLKTPIQLPKAVETSAGYQHEYEYWQKQFSQALIKELNAWADKVVAVKAQEPDLFQNYPEFQPKYKKPFSGEFKIVPIIQIKPGPMIGAYNKNNMFMHITLEFETFAKDEDVEDAIAFVSFLDKNYPQFVSLVTNIYNKIWIANWGKTQKPLDLTGMSTAQQIAALNTSPKATDQYS